MNKHAPGPWKYDEPFVMSESDVLARVYMRDADGNLMAAAPDLLAALKNAVDEYVATEYYCHEKVEEYLAVIAEAEGTAPK